MVYSKQLIFASMEHLEYGNIISPQFPILLVLDVLYAHYLQIDRSKKEALHEYTIQTLQPLNNSDMQETFPILSTAKIAIENPS